MYLAMVGVLGGCFESLSYMKIDIQELRPPILGFYIPFKTVMVATEFREFVDLDGKKFTSLFSLAFTVGKKISVPMTAMETTHRYFHVILQLLQNLKIMFMFTTISKSSYVQSQVI